MTTPEGRRRSPALWVDIVRSFYRRPIAWMALLVSAAFLTYGGGAVLFWFHAIVRGEEGPAIDNVHHWLLDSTLGFVALTPVLALILPLAAWHATGADSQGRVKLRVYVMAVAVLFTVFTGPGPLLHNAVAGAGTPLADLVTKVVGEDPGIMSHHAHNHGPERSPVTEGILQLAVGLPVYTVCTWLALGFVRAGARASRRRTPRALHTDTAPAG